jgi:hypothetical protein
MDPSIHREAWNVEVFLDANSWKLVDAVNDTENSTVGRKRARSEAAGRVLRDRTNLPLSVALLGKMTGLDDSYVASVGSSVGSEVEDDASVASVKQASASVIVDDESDEEPEETVNSYGLEEHVNVNFERLNAPPAFKQSKLVKDIIGPIFDWCMLNNLIRNPKPPVTGIEKYLPRSQK